MPSRWRIPWLYAFTRLSAASVSPTRARTSSTRPSRARVSAPDPPARAKYSRLRRPLRNRQNAGSSTSAPTRSSGGGEPRRTRSPSTSTSPPVGMIRPRAMRIVVVLPAPFGPRNP